ncbi:MAG: hypothetical protein ACOX8B_09115 [Lachnospiraceae bacterium]|jgi:sucrose phosphorylase
MLQKLSNKILLVTSADSLGKNLAELCEVLRTVVKEAAGGIFLLPQQPARLAADGATGQPYPLGNPEFGTGADLSRITAKYYLMLDCRADAETAGMPEERKRLRGELRSLSEAGAVLAHIDASGFGPVGMEPAGNDPEMNRLNLLEMLSVCREFLYGTDTEIVPEIHDTYFTQLGLAARGFRTFSGALPLLLLHAMYTGESTYLRDWMKICPHRQFTGLDPEKGIFTADARHLLPDEKITQTAEQLLRNCPVSRELSEKSAASPYSWHRLNCTLYSALAEDDQKYLCARAIQFFAPGIPAVTCEGLLAGKNDPVVISPSTRGGKLSRHTYSLEDVLRESERPVVKRLLKLMTFRCNWPAFDGTFSVEDGGGSSLDCGWSNGNFRASLHADLSTGQFRIFTADSYTQSELSV